jgi:type 1 glutamine amidotransferase
VRAGGGILAIHSASASFKADRRYQNLIGGSFSGHADYEPIRCHPADEATRATVERSFTVKEELYLHTPAADRTVHLTADTGEPLAWSRRHGAGKVYYLVFGHRPGVFVHPAVQALVTAAVRWLWTPQDQSEASRSR